MNYSHKYRICPFNNYAITVFLFINKSSNGFYMCVNAVIIQCEYLRHSSDFVNLSTLLTIFHL